MKCNFRGFLFGSLLMAHGLVLAEVPIVVYESLDKIEVHILKGRWTEAIGSLKDTPENERGKRYQEYVVRAAVGYLTQLEGNLVEADRMAEELPGTFLDLAKSKAYLRQWDRILEMGFKACFNNSSEPHECAIRLHARIEKEPERTDFLIWAGRETFVHKRADLSFKIFLLGAKSSNGKKVCHSSGLKEAVRGHLATSIPVDPAALTVIKDFCWNGVKGFLRTAIGAEKEGMLLKNVCIVFAEKKMRHTKCPR